MIFKPAPWYPIAVGLGLINVAGAGYAAGLAEPWHAAIHGALALAFGTWAQRLRQAPGGGGGGGGREARLEGLEAIEALETEMDGLRRELSEAQERLDFAERMLAQGAESRRVSPERQARKQPDG